MKCYLDRQTKHNTQNRMNLLWTYGGAPPGGPGGLGGPGGPGGFGGAPPGGPGGLGGPGGCWKRTSSKQKKQKQKTKNRQQKTENKQGDRHNAMWECMDGLNGNSFVGSWHALPLPLPLPKQSAKVPTSTRARAADQPHQPTCLKTETKQINATDDRFAKTNNKPKPRHQNPRSADRYTRHQTLRKPSKPNKQTPNQN